VGVTVGVDEGVGVNVAGLVGEGVDVNVAGLVFVGVGVTLLVGVAVGVSVLVGVGVAVLVGVAVGGAGVLVLVGVGVAGSPGWNRISPQPFVPTQTSPSGAMRITSMSSVASRELSGAQVIHPDPSVSLRPPTARPAI